jgi:hypothetical protein
MVIPNILVADWGDNEISPRLGHGLIDDEGKIVYYGAEWRIFF